MTRRVHRPRPRPARAGRVRELRPPPRRGAARQPRLDRSGSAFFNSRSSCSTTTATAAAIASWLLFSAWFNYFAVCEWRFGQTIGKNATRAAGGAARAAARLTWQRGRDAQPAAARRPAAGADRRRLPDRPRLAAAPAARRPRGEDDRRARGPAGDRARRGGCSAVPPAPDCRRAVQRPLPRSSADAAEALGRQPAAAPVAARPRLPRRGAGRRSAGSRSAGAPQAGSEARAGPRPAFPYADWELRRDALLGLLGGLLLALVLGLPALIARRPRPPGEDLSTAASIGAQLAQVVAFLVVPIGIASGERRPRRGGPRAARRCAASALGASAGWRSPIVAYLVFVALYGAGHHAPSRRTSPATSASTWVAGSFRDRHHRAGDHARRLFFRGMLFGGLRRRLPTLAAAALSGARLRRPARAHRARRRCRR